VTVINAGTIILLQVVVSRIVKNRPALGTMVTGMAIGALGFQIGVSGHRPLILMALMLMMWTGGLLLIVDLNRPRIGMIQVNPAPLVWTIEGFDAMPKS